MSVSCPSSTLPSFIVSHSSAKPELRFFSDDSTQPPFRVGRSPKTNDCPYSSCIIIHQFPILASFAFSSVIWSTSCNRRVSLAAVAGGLSSALIWYGAEVAVWGFMRKLVIWTPLSDMGMLAWDHRWGVTCLVVISHWGHIPFEGWLIWSGDVCGLESKGGVVLPRFRNHWAIVLSQYFSGSNLETFLVVSRMFSSKLHWDTVQIGSGSANPKKAGLPFFTPFFPPHRARVKPGEGFSPPPGVLPG